MESADSFMSKADTATNVNPATRRLHYERAAKSYSEAAKTYMSVIPKPSKKLFQTNPQQFATFTGGAIGAYKLAADAYSRAAIASDEPKARLEEMRDAAVGMLKKAIALTKRCIPILEGGGDINAASRLLIELAALYRGLAANLDAKDADEVGEIIAVKTYR